MKMKFTIILALFFCCTNLIAKNVIRYKQSVPSQGIQKKSSRNAILIPQKTVVLLKLKNVSTEDSISMFANTIDYIYEPEWFTYKAKVRDGIVKWEWRTDKLLQLDLPVYGQKGTLFLIEPGDSIYIEQDFKTPVISGKGAEKFQLLTDIWKRTSLITPPTTKYYARTSNIEEFNTWNAYLNKIKTASESLFKEYKNSISELAFNLLKVKHYSDLEHTRINKWSYLYQYKDKKGISFRELKHIYDSEVLNPTYYWLNASQGRVGNISYYYNVVKAKFLSENYPAWHPIMNDMGKRCIRFAEITDSIFKGEVKANVLTKIIITAYTKYKFNAGVGIKNRFNTYLQHPDYRECIDKHEGLQIERVENHADFIDYFFVLDVKGDTIISRDMTNKVVILRAVKNGSYKDADNRFLLDLRKKFKGDTNIVIANIECGDNFALWKEKVKKQDGIENWFSEGQNVSLSFQQIFSVDTFPAIYVLNQHRRWIRPVFTSPTLSDFRDVMKLVEYQRMTMNDGPYIMYDSTGASQIAFIENKIKVVRNTNGGFKRVKVSTNEYNKFFEVELKGKHLPEACVYPQPTKILVLSDIEGNFEAFKRLLTSNRILDKEFNWIFGDGHLVVTGDIFDRGQQVAECLWLIYAMENKAKAAGGYVHFILGNHEIMNLTGVKKYVDVKYLNNASALKVSYDSLYKNGSELGRWLRSKNIMEKIGEYLFVHAGISQSVNNLPKNISEMNKLIQVNLTNPSDISNADHAYLQVLINSKVSPFWYRGYYSAKDKVLASQAVIDSALSKFDVSRIVTGHTITSDTVSTYYDNKVINTDTHHAEGKSEALLIERKNFYRVNAEGKRVLLFKEEEK